MKRNRQSILPLSREVGSERRLLFWVLCKRQSWKGKLPIKISSKEFQLAFKSSHYGSIELTFLTIWRFGNVTNRTIVLLPAVVQKTTSKRCSRKCGVESSYQTSLSIPLALVVLWSFSRKTRWSCRCVPAAQRELSSVGITKSPFFEPLKENLK